MTEPEISDGYTRPVGDPHDWAATCRWEDAGRPQLEKDGSWLVLVDRPKLDDAELTAIGIAEDKPGGLCGMIRPGTLGYQRCWRIREHRLPHISQDQQAWISSHDAVDDDSLRIAVSCRPDADDPEFCATHDDGMFEVGDAVCSEAAARTNGDHDE